MSKYKTKQVLNEDWGKIERYSNWCELDQLHGETLKEGESLIVEWPDGRVEAVTVVTDSRSASISDMGHSTEIPVSRAYVEFKYRGVTCLAPLVGLKARYV